MNKTLSKAVLAFVFSLVSLSSSAATYSFTPLGTLGGASNAQDINELGQIVGNSVGQSGVSRATLWANGAITDLGTQYALSINDSGQVSPYANINSSGQAVWQNRPLGKPTQATIWTNDSSIFLETPTNGISGANSINNFGDVVGFTSPQFVSTYATLWSNGTATNLGTPSGFESSYAFDINESGQVVGYAYDSSNNPQAILWSNGTITNLGRGVARAINNSGQIVGDSSPGRATIWNGTTASDLTSLLDASVVSAGWVLMYVSDINESGLIVGTAKNTSLGITSQAFLLTPVPEADTSAMLLTGLCVVGFMARRRKQVAA